VPLFVFKWLENNAGTTKQIPYSLDFFKMTKTTDIQLMPKAILKVLALEKMSFSYRESVLTCSYLKTCVFHVVLLNETSLKHSSNKIFSEKVAGIMTPTTFL